MSSRGPVPWCLGNAQISFCVLMALLQFSGAATDRTNLFCSACHLVAAGMELCRAQTLSQGFACAAQNTWTGHPGVVGHYPEAQKDKTSAKIPDFSVSGPGCTMKEPLLVPKLMMIPGQSLLKQSCFQTPVRKGQSPGMQGYRMAMCLWSGNAAGLLLQCMVSACISRFGHPFFEKNSACFPPSK